MSPPPNRLSHQSFAFLFVPSVSFVVKPPRASPRIDYRFAEHEYHLLSTSTTVCPLPRDQRPIIPFPISVIVRVIPWPQTPFPISVIVRVFPWPQAPLPISSLSCLSWLTPARQIPLGELGVFARNPIIPAPEPSPSGNQSRLTYICTDPRNTGKSAKRRSRSPAGRSAFP